MTPTHTASASAIQQSQQQAHFLQLANENSNSTHSTHSMINNWRSQVLPPDNTEGPVRRVIFANTKAPSGDFDASNPQYYSDPNLIKSKHVIAAPLVVAKEEPEDQMPIDLTKKPTNAPRIQNMSDILTPITEPARLMQTLVQMSDKVGQRSFTDHPQFGEHMLSHEYIKECALKESKMKQSQHMHNQEYQHVAPILPPVVISEKYNYYAQTPPKQMVMEEKVVVTSSSGQTLMDTLADLASKTTKLEVKLPLISVVKNLAVNSNLSNAGNALISTNSANAASNSSNSENDSNLVKLNNTDNAKSVASEYLKLTQKKQHRISASEDMGEMSEDQEVATGKHLLHLVCYI